MANIPIYDLTDSWSGGGTFDAIKMNVTDGGSNAASKLLNLQVGGSPLFTVQKDGAVTGTGTFTADRLTVTKTTANAPAISSTGYSLTGSDATSLVDLAGTWDTTGAPTAIKLNITENSATPSVSCNLLDLQRGGVSQCKVSRSGQLTLTGGITVPFQQRISLSSVANMGSTLVSGYSIAFYIDTTNPVAQIQNVVSMFPSLQIGGGTTSSNHPVIIKDGNNTLALQNGTTAQTFNLYSTSSSSNANYERLSLISQAAGAFRIVTQKAGTGAAQALELGTDGTTRLTISTGGNVTVNASGAGIVLPSNGYLTLNGLLTAPSDGVWRLTNIAQNDWGRLQFGGTSSSYPALKRSSATLICRLADDSANAAFESASLKTDAPTGGTAATWKLGAVATVSPTSPDRTIEVDIGGTIYYIHAKTTNN